MRVALASFMSCLLVACGAPPPPAPSTPPAVVRERHVDVHAEGEDLARVMEKLGRQVNRDVLVDVTVQEVVTVDLVGVPWREAVDAIARLCRCEVEERPGGILVLTQPARVTLCVLEASARTVLQLLAASEGRNVIVPDEVRGPARLTDREGHPRALMRQELAAHGDFDIVEVDADLLEIVRRSR